MSEPSAQHSADATPVTAGPTDPKSRASRLFDLRYLIGGLFVLYGVVLTIVGLVDGPAEVAKAAGIRINLWTGLAMLVLGLLFLLWARLKPNRPPAASTDGTGPDGGSSAGSEAKG